MKELTILDGSGYVFRAYYGLPPLHDEDGHNVNAVYGFFRMLFKLLAHKPSHFLIAWDSPKKTKRKEEYEDYKANRVKMPDEFKWQMRMIKELVDELDIPYIEQAGYEADDIIATVVETYAPKENVQMVSIVSSDKDLKQLLRDGVTMFDPLKNIRVDHQQFQKEYGFSPKQMLDYLSLIGDSSDNIPGVRGVGPKSATQLIAERGTLENIYANIESISGSVQQKLKEGQESAWMSRGLVELMHVPEVLDVEKETRSCTYDFNKMKSVLVDTHKFSSLEKILDELKKQRQAGDQLSLFG